VGLVRERTETLGKKRVAGWICAGQYADGWLIEELFAAHSYENPLYCLVRSLWHAQRLQPLP
jgi:hypothetical protein